MNLDEYKKYINNLSIEDIIDIFYSIDRKNNPERFNIINLKLISYKKNNNLQNIKYLKNNFSINNYKNGNIFIIKNINRFLYFILGIFLLDVFIFIYNLFSSISNYRYNIVIIFILIILFLFFNKRKYLIIKKLNSSFIFNYKNKYFSFNYKNIYFCNITKNDKDSIYSISFYLVDDEIINLYLTKNECIKISKLLNNVKINYI